MDDDDDPIVQRPDETRIQPPPPPRAVPPLTEADEVNVVHEEERVRVLPDGTVMRESDRIEQEQSWFRRLPAVDPDRDPRAAHHRRPGALVRHEIRHQDRADGRRPPQSTTRSTACRTTASRCRSRGSRTPARPASSSARTPAGGASADKGSTVRLLVSKGRTPRDVPNAVGLYAGARSRPAGERRVHGHHRPGVLRSAGRHASSRRILRRARAARRARRCGSTSRRAARRVAVPSEVGKTLTDATADLEAKGFKVGTTPVASSEAADTVVSQSPAGGSAAEGRDRPAERLAGPGDDHDDDHGHRHHAHHDRHDAHHDHDDQHHGHGYDAVRDGP